MEDLKFMKAVINRELSLITVLEKLNIISPGEYAPDRTCFCCFHENTETKSAKCYADEDGISLFCFSEQRLYRSSDAFERFTQYPIEAVFQSVWSKLSEDRKNYYRNNFSSNITLITPEWDNFFKDIQPFRLGKMSYNQLLDRLLEVVYDTKNI